MLSVMESCATLSSMESSNVPQNSPAEDLALVRRAQDQLDPPHRFAITYDVLFSITCGVFVASQAMPSTIRPFVTLAVVLALISLLIWWRRRLGWWLSGYAPRRARWVTFAMLVPLLGLGLWAYAAPEPWVAITAGAIATVVAFGASRLWAHVWKRERAEARDVT
jgi:hypothetical protein